MNEHRPDSLDDLQRRVERLEEFLGLARPSAVSSFDPARFRRALMSYIFWLYVPLYAPLLVLLLLMFLLWGVPSPSVLSLPLWNLGDGPTFLNLPVGILVLGGGGIGVISLGGLAIGVLAWGGGAFGVIAMGGGAVGIVAIGGGAIGFIALGGGAIGYIAVGGGACGYYVLAGEGAGRHVFSYKRQDEEAVRFFGKYLPRLWYAFSQPPSATEITTLEP
jgi:hypothetical protein